MVPEDVETSPADVLERAIQSISTGRWAIGVSAGADSVALLRLIHRFRRDVVLHVVHIDHETRQGESAKDARFVQELAESLGMSIDVAIRSELEPHVGFESNLSARYRACRLRMFRSMVDAHRLQGVLLAHHADDQAESVLLRLLRGNGYTGLVGMSQRSIVNGVTIVRPLLPIRRLELRVFLASIGQPWREDQSNASTDFARNRVRMLLAGCPEMVDALLDVSASCDQLRGWVKDTAPRLDEEFRVEDVARWPALLAGESVRQWLVRRDVTGRRIDQNVVARLMEMITDVATASVRTFPSGKRVRRRAGVIGVIPESARS